jgi:hypothetical protein
VTTVVLPCPLRSGLEARRGRCLVWATNLILRCSAQSLRGDAVPVSFWDALDEAMEAQSTQVVSDPSGSHLAGRFPQQLSKMLAQIYCADGCAQIARRERQRAAGQRYQTSHPVALPMRSVPVAGRGKRM